MVAHIGQIEMTELDLPDRVHARISRQVYRGLAEHHLRVTLGKHYKDVPENRPGGGYGVTARTEKYNARKRKRYGHTIANLRTGRARNFARANSRITATQHGSTLRIRFPFPMQARQRLEMEAMTVEELNDAVKLARELYLQEADKPENQRKRKRRV